MVPQQPPSTFTPFAAICSITSAYSSGVVLYRFVDGSGSPAFGRISTGTLLHLSISSTMGSASFGPREQFMPMTSAPSPERVSAIAAALHPVKVRMFCSNDMVQITGRSVFSFAARSAVFISIRSVMVSMAMKSASLPAVITSRNISYASSTGMSPVGRSILPSEPISSPTSTSVPSAASRASFIPCFTICSTVYLLLCSLWRFAPKVFA